jgi:excisionase family DNA binding protein
MATFASAPETVFEPRIGRSVSLDHAADLMGVSRRTIYNRIRDGRLQTIRTLGGSQRVLLDSVAPAERAQAAERAQVAERVQAADRPGRSAPFPDRRSQC